MYNSRVCVLVALVFLFATPCAALRIAPDISKSKETAPPAGWKTYHFYVGNMTLDGGKGFFSQYHQDQFVLEATGMKRNGYFVDLAANDAESLSNTRGLETQYDWDGLCVEANPEYFWRLAYRKCTPVAAMVGKEQNKQVSFEMRSEYGHLTEQVVKDRNKNLARYATATLTNILETHKAPSEMDYLSLDIEGAEDLAMSSFDFNKYSFRVMTVERPSLNLHQKLFDNGYVAVKKLDWWNQEMIYINRKTVPNYLTLMQKYAVLTQNERFPSNMAKNASVCESNNWKYLCEPRCYEAPFCA